MDEIVSIEELDNQVVKKEEPTVDGLITNEGVITDEGLVISRAKPEKDESLTFEQEDKLDRWCKAAMRDYPDMDVGWIKMIGHFCILNPEKAKDYMEKNQHKLYQTKQESDKVFNNILETNSNVKIA